MLLSRATTVSAAVQYALDYQDHILESTEVKMQEGQEKKACHNINI